MLGLTGWFPAAEMCVDTMSSWVGGFSEGLCPQPALRQVSHSEVFQAAASLSIQLGIFSFFSSQEVADLAL